VVEKKKTKSKLKQITREELLQADNLRDICLTLKELDQAVKIPYVCAQQLLKSQNFLTFNDTGEIYFYKKGVYQPNGETEIKAFIQKEIGDITTHHICSETLHHIRRETYDNREKVEETPVNLICLENGIFDINKLELKSHSPKIIFLQKIPVEYNPNAKCPKIEKFLSEVVKDDDIPLLEEMTGHCLLRNYDFQKAFMFVGEGGNGKSKTLGLLIALLGKENVAGRSLQDLLTNHFARADLFGKLANIHADIPKKALSNSADFKMLTGGDLLQAEKKFKNPFGFINYATLIFSANRVPRTEDDTDAFFRRWIIINFPNKFDDVTADEKILEKLTTPEELSGFFNKALEGLKRLHDNGIFSKSKSVNEIRERYVRLSDSVASFVMDLIEVRSDEFVEKKKLFEAYADYCKDKNYPQVAENIFHMRLIQDQNVRVEDYRPTIESRRVQCWKGIKVRDVNVVKVNSNLSKKKEKNLNDFSNEA